MALADEILADSPLAYWKLDDASGATITDSSGNSRNATWVNAPEAYAQTPILPGASACADLEKSNTDYGSIADAAWQTSMSALTLEWCWKLESVPSTQFFTVISKVNDASAYSYHCDYSDRTGGTETGFYFGVSQGGNYTTNGYEGYFPVILQAGRPYHVVVQWDGSTTSSGFKAWLDGVALSFTPKTGGGSLTSVYDGTPALLLAAWAADGPKDTPDGLMSDLAIYGTALSAARVWAHYNAARGGLSQLQTLRTVNTSPLGLS